MSVRISIDAESLELADKRPDHDGARMFRAGSTAYVHIAPEMARQWITELSKIAEEESK